MNADPADRRDAGPTDSGGAPDDYSEPLDGGVPEEVADPTPEQRTARAARADRATRGALAAILGLEALVVLLVPRAIAYTSSGLGLTRTIILLSMAVVFLVAAGLLRRSWGIAVGSVLQLAFILTGIMLAPMFAVGVIFAVIWLALLNLRHEIVGTPGGLRIFVS